MITRRQMLRTMAGAALLADGTLRAAQNAPRASRLGIVLYALAIHQRNGWAGRHQGLAPALAFLEESRLLGAGGIQIAFDPKDGAPTAAEVRRRAEAYAMHVEAIVEPPAADSDLTLFEAKIKMAQAAGATLARCTIMPGRRYEQFKSLAEMREYEARGERALARAEPVLARHRFRLAVENHKDQLIAEKLAMLEHLDSEFIGMCVDVSNNFALLDDPLEAVRAFAPYALTVHIKDHFLYEHPAGFTIEDTALGDGFLDLPAMVETLRKARPEVKFNLETITREAILIPALTEGYYATMPETRASALVRALALVKAKASPKPPQDYSKLSVREQLALERRNVERSLVYARERLGI